MNLSNNNHDIEKVLYIGVLKYSKSVRIRRYAQKCAIFIFSLLVHVGLLFGVFSSFLNQKSGNLGSGSVSGISAENGGEHTIQLTLVHSALGLGGRVDAASSDFDGLVSKASPLGLKARSVFVAGSRPRSVKYDAKVAPQNEQSAVHEVLAAAIPSKAIDRYPTTGGSLAGDPKGQGELLRQIARCLPPGVRPALPLARLEIDLDDNGMLRAAPRLRRYPLMSSQDTLMADRIVQAALQCAPYTRSVYLGQSLSLGADFSSVDATSPPAS